MTATLAPTASAERLAALVEGVRSVRPSPSWPGLPGTEATPATSAAIVEWAAVVIVRLGGERLHLRHRMHRSGVMGVLLWVRLHQQNVPHVEPQTYSVSRPRFALGCSDGKRLSAFHSPSLPGPLEVQTGWSYAPSAKQTAQLHACSKWTRRVGLAQRPCRE